MKRARSLSYFESDVSPSPASADPAPALLAELWLESFSYLRLRDIKNCLRVCRDWSAIASSPNLWRLLLDNYFGASIPLLFLEHIKRVSTLALTLPASPSPYSLFRALFLASYSFRGTWSHFSLMENQVAILPYPEQTLPPLVPFDSRPNLILVNSSPSDSDISSVETAPASATPIITAAAARASHIKDGKLNPPPPAPPPVSYISTGPPLAFTSLSNSSYDHSADRCDYEYASVFVSRGTADPSFASLRTLNLQLGHIQVSSNIRSPMDSIHIRELSPDGSTYTALWISGWLTSSGINIAVAVDKVSDPLIRRQIGVDGIANKPQILARNDGIFTPGLWRFTCTFSSPPLPPLTFLISYDVIDSVAFGAFKGSITAHSPLPLNNSTFEETNFDSYSILCSHFGVAGALIKINSPIEAALNVILWNPSPSESSHPHVMLGRAAFQQFTPKHSAILVADVRAELVTPSH